MRTFAPNDQSSGAGIRPERSEMLPSVTQYEHCRLIDLRPVKPVGDVETALKAKPRDLAQEELLFKSSVQADGTFASDDHSRTRAREHAGPYGGVRR